MTRVGSTEIKVVFTDQSFSALLPRSERLLPGPASDHFGSFTLIRSPVLSGGSTIHSGH